MIGICSDDFVLHDNLKNLRDIITEWKNGSEKNENKIFIMPFWVKQMFLFYEYGFAIRLIKSTNSPSL